MSIFVRLPTFMDKLNGSETFSSCLDLSNYMAIRFKVFAYDISNNCDIITSTEKNKSDCSFNSS
jgi:hypothetical protein